MPFLILPAFGARRGRRPALRCPPTCGHRVSAARLDAAVPRRDRDAAAQEGGAAPQARAEIDRELVGEPAWAGAFALRRSEEVRSEEMRSCHVG
jgi:hypothetical protein